jgi:hypothetical protein
MTTPFNDTWSCATCILVYHLGGGEYGPALNKPARDQTGSDGVILYQCATCSNRARVDCIAHQTFQKQREFWQWLAEEEEEEDTRHTRT